MSMTDIDRIVDFIKAAYPETKIMLHGLHPSCLPSETLKEHQNVGFVCDGEGFLTILQTIRVLNYEELQDNLYNSTLAGLWSRTGEAREPILIKDLSIYYITFLQKVNF